MQFLDIHGLRELWKAIVREDSKNKTSVIGMSSGSGARVTVTPIGVNEDVQGQRVTHTEYTLNLENTAAQSELEKIYGGAIPAAGSSDLKTLTGLASQISSISVSSTDNTITVSNGRDLSVNIDGNTLVKAVNTGIISSGLTLRKTTPQNQTGTNSGVKEFFTLVDANGNQIGDQITIYYESSFKGASLGKAPSDGTAPSGVTPGEDCLILNYINVNGEDVSVYIPLGDFLRESEFGNGLNVDSNGVVSIQLESGSEFLSIGTNGIKVTGVSTAINTAKQQVIGSSTDANDGTAETIHGVYNYVDNELSGKVDVETGKGLSTNDYTNAEKSKLAGIAAGAEANLVNDVQVNSSSVLNQKVANITITEGQTNGTIRVNGADVSVHGLGSAAYENTTAFDASGAAITAENNAKSYTDTIEAAIRGNGAGAATETLTSLRTAIDALGGDGGSIASQINDAIDELKDGYTGTLNDLKDDIDALSGSGSGSIQDRINTSINGLDSSILAASVIEANKTANNVEIEPETYVLTGVEIANGLIINTAVSNTKSVRIMGIPNTILDEIFGETEEEETSGS